MYPVLVKASLINIKHNGQQQNTKTDESIQVSEEDDCV
jgi:hypothetical protein